MKIGPVRYPTETTWECEITDLAPGEHVFTVSSSTGESVKVVVNVEAAFRELEALPEEQRRPIIAKLAEPTGLSSSVSASTATLPIGSASRSATATPTYPVYVPPHATNLEALLKWWPIVAATYVGVRISDAFLKEAGKDLYVLVKGKIAALVAASQLATAQPGHTGGSPDAPPHRRASSIGTPNRATTPRRRRGYRQRCRQSAVRRSMRNERRRARGDPAQAPPRPPRHQCGRESV
jgi:hypothetical protein